MSRTALNFLVDVVLLVNFLVLAWISVVLRFLFPAGTTAQGWRLWGLTYNDWSGLQFNTVAVLALVVLLHVMLHWTWVCGVVVSRLSREKGAAKALDDGTRTLYGVGLLIAILLVLGALTAAAALTMQPPG